MRIQRRGGVGSILNSKSEFDRCRIPRLIVEEQDEEQIAKMEQEEIDRTRNQIEKQARTWENKTLSERSRKDKETWKKEPKLSKSKGSRTTKNQKGAGQPPTAPKKESQEM